MPVDNLWITWHILAVDKWAMSETWPYTELALNRAS